MDDIKCMQTTKGVLRLTRFKNKAVGCRENGHKNTRSSISCLSCTFTESELYKAQRYILPWTTILQFNVTVTTQHQFKAAKCNSSECQNIECWRKRSLICIVSTFLSNCTQWLKFPQYMDTHAIEPIYSEPPTNHSQEAVEREALWVRPTWR